MAKSSLGYLDRREAGIDAPSHSWYPNEAGGTTFCLEPITNRYNDSKHLVRNTRSVGVPRASARMTCVLGDCSELRDEILSFGGRNDSRCPSSKRFLRPHYRESLSAAKVYFPARNRSSRSTVEDRTATDFGKTGSNGEWHGDCRAFLGKRVGVRASRDRL